MEKSVDALVTGQEERILSTAQVLLLKLANGEQNRLNGEAAELQGRVDHLRAQASGAMDEAVMAIRGDIAVDVAIPIQFAGEGKNVVVRWTPPVAAEEGQVVGSIGAAADDAPAATTEAAPTT